MMAYPWEQRPEEPDEAYEAYIADYAVNGHLLVDTDDIRKRLTSEKSNWAATWGWDQRSAEWDAEADRRRRIKFARMQNVAANDLVVMASARLLMVDPESVEPEVLTQLRYTVQVGSELFESSSQTLQTSIASSSTPTEKQSTQKATKRGRPKTKSALPSDQVPTEPEASETSASEVVAGPPEVVAGPPQEPEQSDVPSEQPVTKESSPPPPPPPPPPSAPQPDTSTETSGGNPPTTGPRCGKWGGLTDHRKRGEEPCDECRNYSATRQKAATVSEASPPVGPGSPGAGMVAPVILRPLETEPL